MSLDDDELFYINGGSLPCGGGGLGHPPGMGSPTGTPSNPSGISGPSTSGK